MGKFCASRTWLRFELGPSYYNIYSNINGNPSAAIVLKQIPGTNASTVIEEVKKKLEEIKEASFPPGMTFEISYDVSTFLDASIEQVLHTLLEAFLLVSIVVYMFLGDGPLHPDSDASGADLVDRGLLFFCKCSACRSTDHAVRPGAGHRRRGGRRHRGGGSGACQDARKAFIALSGDQRR